MIPWMASVVRFTRRSVIAILYLCMAILLREITNDNGDITINTTIPTSDDLSKNVKSETVESIIYIGTSRNASHSSFSMKVKNNINKRWIRL